MSNDPYAGMAMPVSDFPQKAEVMNPGNMIGGEVVEVRRFPTDDGDKPILDIKVTSATNAEDNFPGQVRSVICSSSALHALVMAKLPTPGDTVTITCTGLKGLAKLWTLDVEKGGSTKKAAPAPKTDVDYE